MAFHRSYFFRFIGQFWTFGILGLIAIACTQAQEPDSFPTESPTAAEVRIVAALERAVNLRYEKASLRTVVEELHRELKINVEFDPVQLKQEGVDVTKVVIDFQKKDASLRDFLRDSLSKHGLTTVISQDALNIVKADSPSFPRKTVVYPVMDLASDEQALRAVIKSTIAPKSWSCQGGYAEMEFHYPSEKLASLVIVQTEERHQDVCDLLRALRKAKSLAAQSAEIPVAIPVRPLAPAEAKLLAALEKPFNATFDNTPLPKVLEELRREFDIPIEVDHAQLTEAKIDEKSLLVTTHLKEIKLRSFLKVACPSLAAIPMRDKIVISTPQFEFPKHTTITVYPVADLVDWLHPASKTDERTPDADELITLIVSSLFPNRWDEVEGDGGIAFHSQSLCLVVLQDAEVHAAISNLLNTLRKARKLLADPAIAGKPNSLNMPTALRIDQPTSAEQRILEALQKPISATYSKAPLPEVLGRIRKEFDINLHVDEKNIRDEVQPSQTMLVTCHLQEMTLRSFLSTILQDHHLGLTIQNEALTITTQPSSLEIKTTVVYPVEDLVMESDPPLFPGTVQVPQVMGPYLDFDRLIELITISLSPNCHEPSPIIEFFRHGNSKTLVAILPEAAHREIRELITALRRSRDLQGIPQEARQLDQKKGRQPAVIAKPIKNLPTVIPCEPVTPASAKIEAAWQKTLSAHYQETPLSEVIDRLRREFGINIHVCEQRLRDAGLEITKSKVTCDFERITLRSFLDRLGTSHGFKAFYFQEAIRITTFEDYEGSTWGIRVYPVADLSEEGISEFNAEPLTELILSFVASNRWEVFGPTPDFAHVPTASLVISQAPDVHEEIANLLAALRKSRQVQDPSPRSKVSQGCQPSQFHAIVLTWLDSVYLCPSCLPPPCPLCPLWQNCISEMPGRFRLLLAGCVLPCFPCLPCTDFSRIAPRLFARIALSR